MSARVAALGLVLAALGCSPQGAAPSVKDDAERTVREVVAKTLNVNPASLNMDAPISDPPLNADDLDLVEMVMELEERLSIQIPDALVEKHVGGAFPAGKKAPVRITPARMAEMVREAMKSSPAKKP